MSKYLKEHRYVTTLYVWVPTASALIEGCRYDSCYPYGAGESSKIDRLIDGSDDTLDHIVRLVRVARTANPPTVDRWRSFSAHVLAVRHPDDAPPADQELIQMAQLAGVRTGKTR